jgi:UDP-N-acetyl-D-glucosamine dehydrogenase
MPFSPGPGIGGHCIPIDPIYLSWKLRLNGYKARFIALADDINRSMPQYVVELLSDGLNNREKCLKGADILIVGVAYKRGVGDVRESPAIDVINELQRKGARVRYTDPFVSSLAHEGLEVQRVALTAEVLGECDAAVILTDHQEFDYHTIVQHADLIIDGRNATRGMTIPEHKVIRL